MEPAIPTFEAPKPQLLGLPLAISRFSMPASYQAAAELFALARQDFEDGAPERAAPKFMTVATHLKAPSPPAMHSTQYAQMRLVSYKNAVICFGLAADPEGARKALNKAIQQDTENADALKKLLATIR